MLNPKGSERSIPKALSAYMVHNDDEDNENVNDNDSSTNVNTVPILKLLAINTYKIHEKNTDIVEDKYNNNTC